MNERKLRVAGYIRVSTENQASDEHYSLPEQKERLEAFCMAKGWDLVKVYTDPGYSGKSLDRPAIQQLIAECKLYDIILVNKLDRLSRSQKDTLYLIEDVFRANNVQFASMSENFDTSTPLGMAMIGILSTFAQLEREQIKERMITGKLGRAKKGLFSGGKPIPTGYDYKDGQLIPNADAPLVQEAYERFIAGESLRQISLHIRKKYSIKGEAWDGNRISRIVRDPVYIGKIRYKGEEYDGVHQPMITTEQFERAQQRYALIDHKNPNWQNPTKKLLTGIIFCGKCGGRYGNRRATFHRHGKVYVYTFYRCYSDIFCKGPTCKSRAYRQADLDAYIMTQIEALDFEEAAAAPRPTIDHTQEIQKLQKQKNRLIDLFSLDMMDMDVLKAKIAEIEAKINALTPRDEKSDKLSLEEAKPLQKVAAETFQSGDVMASRQIITSLIKRITLYDDEIRIEWNF